MELAVYQLIAYVSLTIASLTVALTSAVIGYWQIFGWQPTVFVTGIGVSRIAGGSAHMAKVTFEVWNRRKYPIAITPGSSIIFKTTEVAEGPGGGDWQKWRNTMCYYGPKVRIEPLSHHEFVVDVPLKVNDLAAIDDNWPVQIKYFDPTSSKEITISAVAQYRQSRETESRA